YDGSNVLRGQRGSQLQAHPQNAAVSLFGYSSHVAAGTVSVTMGQIGVTMPYTKLPTTNATTPFNFGPAPMATVCGDKQDTTGTPPIWYIDMAAAQLGVMTTDIMQFPDQGFLKIDNEIIFYTARSTGPVSGTMPPSQAKFTGLQRGQLGTTAARHNQDRPVELWSVAASNPNGFPVTGGSPTGTTGTLIQIGDEWF